MAEVKLMKGNEVIAEAAIRCGCDGYLVTRLPRNLKSWKPSCCVNHGKRQAWWYCRQKANWPRSIWYMAVHLVVKK